MNNDYISRQAAIDALDGEITVTGRVNAEAVRGYANLVCDRIKRLPSAQPEKRTEERTETHACDCISKTAAIDIVEFECGEWRGLAKTIAEEIEQLPSVQQERTCVNCGRTANNGGWYADGGTRCPIEEHYALPKDGFCHLWEKRNITDDDYPERRTDGEIIPE